MPGWLVDSSASNLGASDLMAGIKFAFEGLAKNRPKKPGLYALVSSTSSRSCHWVEMIIESDCLVSKWEGRL